MLDPVSLILAALGAGAIAATKDVAGSAVKEAYESLKKLIKHKFADNEAAKMVLDEHEKDPETYKIPLTKKLTEAGIDQDAEILKSAEEILKKEDPEGFQGGKYNIHITGGTQGVVGENKGTVNMGR